MTLSLTPAELVKAARKQKQVQLEETLATAIAGCRELPLPEREYRFHPVRLWRFDFAYPDRKLALEIEGGTFSDGRHTRGAGFERDCEKYGAAALAGWTVLRVTGRMVKDGRALQLLREALKP